MMQRLCFEDAWLCVMKNENRKLMANIRPFNMIQVFNRDSDLQFFCCGLDSKTINYYKYKI